MPLNKLGRWLAIGVFLLVSVVARVANLQKALYFTWDQGRDFFAVEKIAQGDFVLVGQTTGIPGFFYGPLWYYLGVPGYLIGHADPGFFTYWYLFICLAATLPLIWWLSHRLFKSETTAILTAFALSLSPGVIWTSLRVWNILTALPFLLGSLVAFTYAKTSRLALAVAFFFLALLLQSEFAYGIFLVAPLWLIIRCLRDRFDWRDYLVSAGAILITLVPQLLFDLRNNWLMSKSLITALTKPAPEKVGWLSFWFERGQAMWQTSAEAVIGQNKPSLLISLLVITILLIGLAAIYNKFSPKKSFTVWHLIGLMAILPYLFFFFWRGNDGFFFSYYLSPHVILLMLIVVKGLEFLWQQAKSFRLIWFVVVSLFIYFWATYLFHIAINPTNNAGWAVMNHAITQILGWSEADGVTQPVIKVLTPNRETEHYDAIIHHQFKKAGRPIPLTVRDHQEKVWYVLEEPDPYHPDYEKDWYLEARSGGKIIREEKVGDLLIQTWTASNSAQLVP